MAYRKTANTKTDPNTGRRVSMWKPQLVQRVHTLYVKDGLSMEKTARKIGCATATVQQLLVSKGWNRRIPQHLKKTLEFLDANKSLALLAYEKHSAQKIAKAKGLSLRGVTRWLKAQGVWRESAKERFDAACASGIHTTVQRRVISITRLVNTDADALHPLEYHRDVRRLTRYVYQDWKHVLDPKGKRSYSWHLDHVFGIANAQYSDIRNRVLFDKKVPIWAVCHPANLRVITGSDNSNRHNVSDPLASDVASLKRRIRRFNSKYGDPFEKYRQKEGV